MLEILFWVPALSLPLKALRKLLQKIKNRGFPD
jgi:hypothetical protein